MRSKEQSISRARGMVKKFRFFRSFVTGRPVWCSWQITDHCNFKCKFCSVWKKPCPTEEQSLEQIEQSAARLARIGTMVVSITGGEPLVRKDLPDIVRVINRHHFPFVSTNGSLVTPEKARALAEAGLWGVGVSIDYADEARHDAARGREGAHRQAMEALRIFREQHVRGRPRANLMCTLLDDNYDDLPALAETAQRLGCDFRVQPYSTLKTGDRTLLYPRPVAKDLLALRQRFPNFATSPVVLKNFDLALTSGVPGCVAGRYMLNIDPAGRVAKCPEDQAHPVGHILTDSPKALRRALRERHRCNTCKDCWYNCRNEMEVSYTFRGMFHAGMRNFLGR